MTSPPHRLAELTTTGGETLLGPLVRHAYRWFQEGVSTALAGDAEPALTMGQVELFANIDREGTSIAELARRSATSRQTTHRLVHSLVEYGFVEIIADPASMRRRLVRPTRRGHRHLVLAHHALLALEELLVERLGEAAVAGLREALDGDWGDPTVRTGDGALR